LLRHDDRETVFVSPTVLALAETTDRYQGAFYALRPRVNGHRAFEIAPVAPRSRIGDNPHFTLLRETNERFMHLCGRAVARGLASGGDQTEDTLGSLLVQELAMQGRTRDEECAALIATSGLDPAWIREKFDELIANCMNHKIDDYREKLAAPIAHASGRVHGTRGSRKKPQRAPMQLDGRAAPPSSGTADGASVPVRTEIHGDIVYRIWADREHIDEIYPCAALGVTGEVGEMLVAGARVAACALSADAALRGFIVYVEPEHRNRGYGKLLAKFAIGHAMEHPNVFEVHFPISSRHMDPPVRDNRRYVLSIFHHCCEKYGCTPIESETILIIQKDSNSRAARKRRMPMRLRD
jgi:GNAT superfamily N-acetyltransferase